MVSAYAHSDKSRDDVDVANDVAGSVAVGSAPPLADSVVAVAAAVGAVVDPVSAAAGIVEAEVDRDMLVPALALEIEPEPA